MRILWLLVCVMAVPVSAQNVEPPAPAILRGVAVDSLRGGLLGGAMLRVTGTTRVGVTDSLGRFYIDSVPAGSHAVELFHGLLDTLGVRVRTEPLAFGVDSVVLLVLGIPSGQTIVSAKCGTDATDQGAIVGMVFSADGENPLAGVNVRLSWTAISVGGEFGIREEPHQTVVLTDAAGRYKFCGLPNELAATLSAGRGADDVVSIPVGYEAAMLAVVNLFLPGSGSTGGAGPEGSASLRGVVVDSGGNPLAGAHVGLTATANAAITDSAGRFELRGVVPGSQTLVARRLGYLPTETVVHVTGRVQREVVVRLDTYVPVLEAVFVEAKRNLALERVGFTERQRMGLGQYFSPADLERRAATKVTDLLAHLPPPRRRAAGPGCNAYWVDGLRWQGNVDEFISPDEVAAIEVYSPVLTPVEFKDPFRDCRTIVIWSKWRLGTR